jgi:hypothetical protein
VALLQVFAELGQVVVQTGEQVVAADVGVTDPANAQVELPLLGAVPGTQPSLRPTVYFSVLQRLL